MAIEHRALFAVSIAFTVSIVAYPDLPSEIPPRLGRHGPSGGAPLVGFLLPVTATVVWWLLARFASASMRWAGCLRRLGMMAAIFLSVFHVLTLLAFIGREPQLAHGLGMIAVIFVAAAGKELLAVAVVLLVCLGATNAFGQGIEPARIRDLPQFIDAIVPKLMTERHVVGSAVVVVHDGRVILSRGYGRPHVDSTSGVDATRTLFRIGSLTKVFTAAAVLQLAEIGKLDLHRDVRELLPDIPLRYGVTTHQLLTHTAGFDERFAGAYTNAPEFLQPLSTHVRRYLPGQVFRPGTTSSYSGYNYVLAGVVLERVSGRAFEHYMAERIFAPLKMTSTSAAQPPPEHIASGLARGYRWVDGRHEPLPYTYTHGSPSGGMTTTAADSGTFMLAALGGGDVNGVRILAPPSIQKMLTPQWSPHPRSPGIPYGFGMTRWNGARLLTRGGTLGDQSAFMVLAPEAALGVVVLSNALPGIGDFLFAPMMTHLAGSPVSPSLHPPLPNAAERANRYVGTYRSYRHAGDEMSRIRSLMPMMQRRVTAEADGAIRWQGQRWREIDPLVFQGERSGDVITFHVNERGEVLGLGSYERISWREQTPFHAAILLPSVLAFAWYVISIVRCVFRPWPRASEGGLARWCAALVSGANVAFVIGLLVFFREFGAIVPLPLHIATWLALPMISVAVTALLPAFTALAWKEQWWSTRERLGYSAVTVAAITFMTFLNYWKLLGVRY